MPNNNLVKLVRRATLVTSLFGSFLFQDPNDLATKIRQRLSQKGISVPQIVLPSPSPEGDKLLESGELTRSVEHYDASGWFGKLRSKKIRSQAAELDLRICPSTEIPATSDDVRILFYLTNSKPYTNSGYTERTQHILEGLQEGGIQVRGATRLGYPVVIGNFPLEEASIIAGVQYKHLLPSFYPSDKLRQLELAVQMLVAEAKDFGATILHTTTDFKNAIVVSHAAERLGIPWIYETRGELEKTWLSKRPPSLKAHAEKSEYFLKAQFKENEAMQRAAAVVALSAVSKEQAVRRGIEADKIHVIPNAISESELERSFDRKKIRDQLNLPPGKLIGAITSLVGYEGLDDLLRAVTMLSDVNCIIVGDGESRRELEDLTTELGISDRVRFVGRQDSSTIWQWYATLDVMVVPRKNLEVTRTVTPIKTLLAQGLGTPVVASDLPALKEVTGGLAVYSVPENPESLAVAINEVLMMDEPSLEYLAQRGRAWVRTRTWSRNVEALARIYKSDVQEPEE
ncbi:glycosyltransferase family 4 protein [Corynebacteriaceae bacterium 6-324]